MDGRVEVCKFMERSEVGVESSIAEGWVTFWPLAVWSCWSCCCWVRIMCSRRFYNRLLSINPQVIFSWILNRHTT